MGEQRHTELRSYRSVFALERRIYRIDRLRLNPSGVPVRGVGYAVALLVVAQILEGVPVLGDLAGLLPWPIRDLVIPLAIAGALIVLRLDGRHGHHALLAAARYLGSPRNLSGFTPCAAIGTTWRPGQLVVLPDGSDPVLRSMRYRGPGQLAVRIAHSARITRGFRGRQLEIEPRADLQTHARGIRVPDGGSVRVRGERSCARR